MKGFAWSLNGSDWKSGSFETKQLAIYDAIQETDNETECVYIGNVELYSNKSMLPRITLIIDDMRDRAIDLAGEYADDYLDVSKEQILDLENKVNNTIIRWCEINDVSPAFYTIKSHERCKIR